MQHFHQGNDLIVTRSQLSAAARIAAPLALESFGEEIAIRSGDVPSQITEREFSLTICPVYFVWRNATDNPHGPLMNFVKVVKKYAKVPDFHIHAPFPGSVIRGALEIIAQLLIASQLSVIQTSTWWRR
jgi:hypothetical protein